MPLYFHGRKEWPNSFWDPERIASKLAAVRYRQGRLVGRMEAMSIPLQSEANWHMLTLEMAGPVSAGCRVEGIVEMMLDATQHYNAALTAERLFSWHADMFPTRRTGIHHPVPGKEKVHFQTPNSDVVVFELNRFLNWFNAERSLDPVIKAAIAHLWFVTIRPFDDGNVLITAAITEMQLSRADQNARRFYSMSAQIRAERKEYDHILEKTQKGSLDITAWLDWFINCLDRALTVTDGSLGAVMKKARFWEKHASTPLNNRQRMMLNKLLDGLDGPNGLAGKLTSSKWAAITKTSQDSAGRDITDLLHRGILSKEPGGGRSTSYRLSSAALSGYH